MATKHTIKWNLYRKKGKIEEVPKELNISIEDFPEIREELENLDFRKSLDENLLMIFEKLNIDTFPEKERILIAARYAMQIKVISLSTIMNNIVIDAEEEGIVINQEEYKKAFKEIEKLLGMNFFDFLIFLKEYFKDNYKMI